MSKEKKIYQPTHKDEVLADSVINNTPSEIIVRGKKWKIGWLYKGTVRAITHLMLSDKEVEDTVTTKAAAILRLNGYWKIKFFYWFLWRWMFYIKQYHDSELLPYIAEGKKKMDVQSYLVSIMFLTGMKDTKMAMNREEVMRIQAEQLSGQHGQSEKTTQD